MIPILYRQIETEFITGGICRLVDCISCEVAEERNGIYECEFVYPVSGRHFDEIKEGRIILCTHDNTGETEPFDIYARSVPIDGQVTFYAHHVSYRLSNYILRPFSANGAAATMAAIPWASLSHVPFTFWTDKTNTTSYSITNPRSIKDTLGGSEGSMLDVFGTGEYEWNRFEVRLHLHRGEDRGVEIRYRKNLLDLQDDESYEDVYNAIVPYWLSPETGEMVTLPEWFVSVPGIYTYEEPWTVDGGTITDGSEEITFEYSPLAVRMVDYTSAFQFRPTADQLREYALSHLEASGAWEATRSIDVDFVLLWQTEDYKDIAPLEEVSLCDTVTVIYPEIGINVKKKVVRVVYDVLSDRYSSMELGSSRTSFGGLVTDIVQQDMDPVSSEELSAAVSSFASAITGNKGGNVVILMVDGKPTELLMMDTDNIQTARNVWRWNLAGLGHSSNGYNGNYDELAILADGAINASRILTGYLSADRIKTGRIVAENSDGFWDLDNGEFYNVTVGTADTTSFVRINGGQIRGGIVDNDAGNNTYNIRGTATTFNGTRYRGVTIQTESSYLSFSRKALDGTNKAMMYLFNKDIMTDDTVCKGSIGLFQNLSFKESAYLEDSTYITVWGPNVQGGSTNDSLARIGSIYNWNGSRLPTISVRAALGFCISAFVSGSTSRIAFFVNRGHYGSTDDIGDVAVPRYLIVGGYHQQYKSSYSSNKLEVLGDAYVQGTVRQGSDERKKNVREWDSRYDDLFDRLEILLYTWKDREDDETHIGVSAQRTEKAAKELGIDGIVGGDGTEEKPYGVNYMDIAMLAAKRVQDLEKRLAEAERKIEELCGYINSLH